LSGEDLLLYIVATTHVVSSAIVVERSEEGYAFGVQRPVYFVSEVLSNSSETFIRNSNYIKKVAPLLRRVQDHCDYGFSVGGYATGRISKWAMELGALSIDFKPRTAIKSQALVNFMAEWRENQIPTLVDNPEHWIMYFDGSLKLDGDGAGVLFISPRGEQLKYVSKSFGRYPIMKPSMKHSFTGSVWRYH
jgi:hypothetical protein